jgi:superfamily II DNA or RNA helicase
VDIDGTRCRAAVGGAGDKAFRAGVDWRLVEGRRVLHAFCECKRFGQGSPCEHLWATLLALDELDPQVQPAGSGRVGLRKDRASAWSELGVEEPTEDAQTMAGPRARPKRRSKKRSGRGRRSRLPAEQWRSQLATLQEGVDLPGDPTKAEDGGGTRQERKLRFLINTTASANGGGLILDVFAAIAPRGKVKRPAKLRPTAIDSEELARALRPQGGLPLPLLTVLPSDAPGRAVRPRHGRQRAAQSGRSLARRFRLPPELFESVIPALCATDGLGWWDGRPRSPRHPLTWDEAPAWHLALRLETTGLTARIMGSLVREEESISVSEPVLVFASAPTPSGRLASAFVLFPDRLARLDAASAFDLAWIRQLREVGDIVIPKEHLAEAVSALVDIPGLPLIEGPEEFQLAEERSPMQPRLVLESDAATVLPNAPLFAEQSFLYGNVEVSAEDPNPSVVDWQERTFVQRDMDGEHQALLKLLEAGAEPVPSGDGHELQVSQARLPTVVEPLLAEGWEVEVRGNSLRMPSPPSMRVESGTDWFEVSGSTDFAGDRIELKEILDAISSGDRFIKLDDGSRGLLPESWMETYGSLAQLAQDNTGEEGLRFLPSQALLVDVLLTAMPPADVDGSFSRLREKLRSFESIKPKKEPRGFGGTLREYQREGLAWLGFLREFGLGGVLADDMGLGKTVQVLALLRANRTPSKTTGLPSLVLAPRSLVYNWIDEAKRFTPTLKVVEYRGAGREAMREKFADYDIIVTTYGTLRRDVDFLATVEFDTLVLDEAQAVKNRESLSAKACRVLRAKNRLALTGTPIENHLGELGSIFEIINPGLLGNLPRLEVLVSGRAATKEELALVADGIRPFILRRTKGQVLKDLPPKTEQVLYCTLRAEQQELYDKLRLAYQGKLLGEVEGGRSGNAIQVLEALLRLRQVACHPGLVDTEWESAGSAKLDALFDQVSEVLEEGHKVIVFSQFTKLLAYVRQHLDEQGRTYAYLDGQTRDRGEVVERFQTDPETNLFLISLKAGGLGLNLTAAGYVFLLDPWWNPAVEAQAIDRAHRIGQTQPVFAYRMIARGTVEEKILELQSSKRKLVEAVLEGEQHSMPNLTADDLRVLLS